MFKQTENKITILSYNTKLEFDSEADKQAVFDFLELERDVLNFCSEKHFGSKSNNIKELHAKVYRKARKLFTQAKSQLVIRAERECLALYRSAKSNRHKLTKPIFKHKLAVKLDKRLFSLNDGIVRLTTLGKRISAKLVMYDKLKEVLAGNSIGDISLFVKNGELFVTLPIKVQTAVFISKQTLAIGVDLGIRRVAATSEGKLFIDKKFNADKRKLRYLKRVLQSQKTRTAKKHLYKLRRKERNVNTNFAHHAANAILKSTKANTIVLEKLDCKSMKAKRHYKQNKNRISQASFSKIRQILTYKAGLYKKTIVCVNPAYTSQTDHLTSRREGKRQGCRFYTVHNLVYDSDVNAAVNIAKLAKLPVSCKNVLDGQAVVNQPIVNRLSADVQAI